MELLFLSSFSKVTGYGSTAEGLALSLDALGVSVVLRSPPDFESPVWDHIWLDPRTRKLLSEGNTGSSPHIGLAYGLPGQVFPLLKTEYRIGMTMWESTKLPEARVKLCNEMDEVWVPCTQNLSAFQSSGVKVPLRVMPLGYDSDFWVHLQRESRVGFTFLLEGWLSLRKGWDLAVRAFHVAFDPPERYPDVRLYLKSSDAMLLHLDDPDHRVSIFQGVWHPRTLLELYRLADCFLYPTRGEGWGLGPLQAMATGLPVICTAWGGPADYLSPEYSYPIDRYVLCPSKIFGFPGDGLWAEPDFDMLVYLMRHVYENREEASLKGQIASQYVKETLTFRHCAKRMLENLDREEKE